MKYLFTLIILLLIIRSNAQSRIQDSLGLINFYDSMDGDNWIDKTNWKTSTPINTWYGVGIPYHNTTNRVTGLSLSNNNLSGIIPTTSIEKLTGLTYIDLSYNKVYGIIPLSIGNLDSLYYLNLSYNKLSGPLPDTIGGLDKLQSLYLEFNNLSGEIPDMLGRKDSSGLLPGGMQLNNNEFTFAGMEAKGAAVTNGKDTQQYSPQAEIHIIGVGNILSVSVGGTPANNTYLWYNVGSGLIKTSIGDSTFSPSGYGNYVVVVNNSVANKLTLPVGGVNERGCV